MQNKMDSALSECLEGLKKLHSSGINEQEGHYLCLVATSAYMYRGEYETATVMAKRACQKYQGFGSIHSVSNSSLEVVIGLLELQLGRGGNTSRHTSEGRTQQSLSQRRRAVTAAADFMACDLYYLAYVCMESAATLDGQHDEVAEEDIEFIQRYDRKVPSLYM